MRRVLIARDSGFDPAVLPREAAIQEVLGAVAAEADRTRRIAEKSSRNSRRAAAPLS